ncbi:3-deoxy-D-arabino-heptulosonate-7-phosphate (DAHP) synthase [Komagataella phaffii CBS 7435]|uniref:3-deoxy-7-phosphoheptulonate synthase n=1 Tax=Komagataella phaffii (strain ATCC 76273 / CBS 7435 / CECT 11047 / NRRL Y-11430 / Wegner 21-1) TaxID=981350 RepID=F2QSX5_KOMPC|nr:GQ67_00520T0 [Komagataella phaffii]AOA67169.1 GQ68_00868T0 [Komagataella phaffii GS115]CAH2448377.1 3-deoxy-D-arabino-heptulosonate-7-phosphate (DAHP) synthase [Komagataella phaffii CBS 7435]CCA38503.1 3-deoxy-D-arabino-heptulosonate-7-phosphate (DAHP) synthase [Komagataella phaffii CBS 7435]
MTVQEVDPKRSRTPPVWDYGLNKQSTNSRPPSSQGSGLLLSEKFGHSVVPQPEVLQQVLYPTNEELKQKILTYRNYINSLIKTDSNDSAQPNILPDTEIVENKPLLVITGPEYIKDGTQAKRCAQWIAALTGKRNYKVVGEMDGVLEKEITPLFNPLTSTDRKDLLVTMRTNLSEYGNGDNDQAIMSYEIQYGIPICRVLLTELAQYCPLVGELSDTLTPQYVSDLYCIGLLSHTYTESQLHRELASGVSYPVGFQVYGDTENAFNHKLQSSIDAIYSTSQEHHFLSVTKLGSVAVIGTTGNSDTFLILKLNGDQQDSYLEDIAPLVQLLQKHIVEKFVKIGRPDIKIMLDIGSIDNEGTYKYKELLLSQILANSEVSRYILGVIIDSGDSYLPESLDLEEESQSISGPPQRFDHRELRQSLFKNVGKTHEKLDKFFFANRLLQRLVELSQKRRGKNK